MGGRELTTARVPGCENPADLGTKHLAQREMHECMRRAGLPDSGRTFEVGFYGSQEGEL